MLAAIPNNPLPASDFSCFTIQINSKLKCGKNFFAHTKLCYKFEYLWQSNLAFDRPVNSIPRTFHAGVFYFRHVNCSKFKNSSFLYLLNKKILNNPIQT